MEDSQPVAVVPPVDGWNEIVPGLFMGGQEKRMASLLDFESGKVRVAAEFDAVFSFYWAPCGWEGPDDDIAHIHYPIPDGALCEVELTQLQDYARMIAENVRAGNKVLVRCQAGLNRSGLVVGFALMELGYAPRAAIAQIRLRRSPDALCNKEFVRYLEEAA